MRILFMLVSLCLGMFTLSEPAIAQAPEGTATVRVDGRSVFQVGPSIEGEDPRERASRIEDRISPVLRNLDSVPPAVVRPAGTDWVVTVAGIPVVTVTPRDAEDNFIGGAALSRQWARAIDAALDRARDRRLGFGGRFLAETRASGEAALGRMTESAARIVPRALAALIVIGLFWVFARAVRWLLRKVFTRTVDDVTVESLIKQLRTASP